MSLMGKSWKLKIPIGLGVLALLVTIGLTGQSNPQDPQERTQPKGELKFPATGTSTTPDNRVPFVGPQSHKSGIPEPLGESRLIPPSELSLVDPSVVNSMNAAAGLVFGKDRFPCDPVINWPLSFNIREHAMTSHPNGRIYVAHTSRVGQVEANQSYIRVSYSEDQGLTWKILGFAWDGSDTTRNFSNPSIAVTDTHVIIAYEVHKTGVDPIVEVATSPVLGGGFTAHSVLHGAQLYELKPYIWSDLHSYSGSSSAYLIFEQVVDWAGQNINIFFQRTGDDGATWKDSSYPWGSGLADTFVDPHGCWGEATNHKLYITAYNNTTHTIVMRRSSDWGMTFDTDQSLYTLTSLPTYSTVAPVIAASVLNGTNAVWINFILQDGTDDDMDYLIASSNPGTTFSGPFAATGQTTAHEQAPQILADPAGKYLHMVWTVSNTVKYATVSPNFSNWKLGFLNPLQANAGGSVSHAKYDKGIATDWEFGFAGISWEDYNSYDPSHYAPFFNRHVPDDLVGTWDGQGVYFRTDGNQWVRLANPALQVAAGDLDGAADGTADLVGVWTGQGLNAVKSTTGAWAYLGTAPDDIAVGNMDGGSYEEVVATWTGQGVYYLTILGGTWTNMATPATMITAGDLDGDGIDDLIGVWPAQAGVWVKYSQTGTWSYIGSAPRHIATGDMDGDGRSDLLGTWDGQGVYWRKSQTGAWTYLGTPATLITSADMDGDGKDDVVGIWPSQAGVWTKYSSDNQWEYIGSAVRDFSSGKMRGGSNTWGAANVEAVETLGQSGLLPTQNFSANSPGAPGFKPLSQPNLIPVQDPLIQVIPGPGMPGFTCTVTPNPIPVHPRDRKIGSEMIQR